MVKMNYYGMRFPELCNAGFVDTIMDSDATYNYIAYADCGTVAASPDWAVKRIHSTTGSITWAGGTNDKIHAATDLPGLFA